MAKASRPPGRSGRTYNVDGQTLAAAPLPPGLYLVATPIGNLGDITLRALGTLAAASVIACEDTRVTHRLLSHYGIATPTIAYHEHNAAAMRPQILARLAANEAVALVSDAGTPLVSDPGFKLVREATAAGHFVTAVPGASSTLTALSVAALPTDRFFFEGFLPPKTAARQKRIADIARIGATLVLFETGPRLAESLADLASGLGARDAAICRELTKLHEEIRRGSLAELARHYAAGGETRGEFVIVVAPAADETAATDDLDALLRQALARVSVKDAVGEVAVATGLPRRDVYRRALELTKESEHGAAR
jgi:16S rRNA (cytidine1402-2'-O)-methyltransferase